jgi:hypothetical protein
MWLFSTKFSYVLCSADGIALTTDHAREFERGIESVLWYCIMRSPAYVHFLLATDYGKTDHFLATLIVVFHKH